MISGCFRGVRQSGFTLIEILVTLLILAIGLLGLAGLQSKMLTTEFEAYQRSHALVLVQDMVSRINANRAAARSLEYSGAVVYGTGSAIATDCDPAADVVDFDLCSWNAALLGAAVESGDDKVGSMVGARGCIERISGSATSEVVLRVTVAWQGMTPTVESDLSCGEGEYGDDKQRRTVSMLVTLAYLGV